VVQKKETENLEVAVVVDWSMKTDVFDFKAVDEIIYILRKKIKYLNLSFNRYILFRKKRKR
jgi:hypothetical protein